MIIVKQDDRAVIVAPAPDWMGSMEELAALASQGRPWRVITQADIPDASPDQWLWTDAGPLAVAQAQAQAVTADQVNAERNRRLGLPFPYMGHLFDRDPVSLQRITGAATMAGFALAGLMPATPTAWITADNTEVPLTPIEMLGLGAAAAERERAIVFAARAIKDLPEIPADFHDDKYWP